MLRVLSCKSIKRYTPCLPSVKRGGEVCDGKSSLGEKLWVETKEGSSGLPEQGRTGEGGFGAQHTEPSGKLVRVSAFDGLDLSIICQYRAHMTKPSEVTRALFHPKKPSPGRINCPWKSSILRGMGRQADRQVHITEHNIINQEKAPWLLLDWHSMIGRNSVW